MLPRQFAGHGEEALPGGIGYLAGRRLMVRGSSFSCSSSRCLGGDARGPLALVVGGSYSRGTTIPLLSGTDIDVSVVLDPSNYEANGQASLLDKVKRVSKQIYPKTPEIRRNGEAAAITFSESFEKDRPDNSPVLLWDFW